MNADDRFYAREAHGRAAAVLPLPPAASAQTFGRDAITPKLPDTKGSIQASSDCTAAPFVTLALSGSVRWRAPR